MIARSSILASEKPIIWTVDYPDSSDAISIFYGSGPATYATEDNLVTSNFTSLAPSTPNDLVHVNGSAYTQAQVWSWMQGNITLGNTSVDPAVRQSTYETATKLAIDMGLYVYVYQYQQFWYFRTWIKGYAMQENPVIGGDTILVFYWLTKG